MNYYYYYFIFNHTDFFFEVQVICTNELFLKCHKHSMGQRKMGLHIDWNLDSNVSQDLHQTALLSKHWDFCILSGNYGSWSPLHVEGTGLVKEALYGSECL